MIDAFGVSKSFSSVGGFKPLSAMTAAERAGIRGSHKAAHGMTDMDAGRKKIWENTRRLMGGEAPANASPMKNRKGRLVLRTDLPKKQSEYSKWIPSFPKPGQSQRTMPGRIAAPQKSQATAHELEHTTRRKPASAAARLFGQPKKLWGDEARADSAMKPKAQEKSDYLLTAQGKRSAVFGSAAYSEGYKSGGGQHYMDVKGKIAARKKP